MIDERLIALLTSDADPIADAPDPMAMLAGLLQQLDHGADAAAQTGGDFRRAADQAMRKADRYDEAAVHLRSKADRVRGILSAAGHHVEPSNGQPPGRLVAVGNQQTSPFEAISDAGSGVVSPSSPESAGPEAPSPPGPESGPGEAPHVVGPGSSAARGSEPPPGPDDTRPLPPTWTADEAIDKHVSALVEAHEEDQ